MTSVTPSIVRLLFLDCDVCRLESSCTAVIIDGQNFYDGTYTCTITPKIQNMIANYTEQFIDTTLNDSAPNPVDAQAIGWAGVFALQEAFGYGQTTLRNSVGDALLATFDDEPEDFATAAQYLNLLVRIACRTPFQSLQIGPAGGVYLGYH